MHVAHRSCFQWLSLGVALGVPACTLTRPLNDLQGGGVQGGASGTVSASGGGGASGGEVSGSAGTAGAAIGAAGMGDAGSAGEAGGGAQPTLPNLILPEQNGLIGWLSISLQFSTAMAQTTLSVPVGDSLCTGRSLQISKDDFKTCLEMAAAPVLSKNGTVATFSPVARLTVGDAYRLRITTQAKSTDGLAFAATDLDVLAGYSHTIVQTDSVNHFFPEEKFDTSTMGYTLYVAWDAGSLYLGMDGQSISDDMPNTMFLTYLGAGAGSKVGDTFGTHTASLSFLASAGVAWSGDNLPNKSFSLLSFKGSMWSSSVQTGTPRRNGNFVQFGVPWANLSTSLAALVGTPNASASFAAGLVNLAGSEYAMSPKDSLLAKGHYVLDLSGKQLPENAQLVTP